GMSIALKPEGFSAVDFELIQQQGEESNYFYLYSSLNDNEWNELQIPFHNFYSDQEGAEIDPAKGFTLSIQIPFSENYHRFHFRTGSDVGGSLLIDNIGVYNIKTAGQPDLLDSFNDEVSRMMFSVGVYGSSTYTDYSVSEEGKELVTPGVTNQKINIRRLDSGSTGSYLSIQIQLDLVDAFQDFLDREESLGISVYAIIGKPWGKKHDTLSFSIRSDVLQQGSLDIHDYDGEEYYYADISANPIWTRIRLPFSELFSDTGSLAVSPTSIERAVISFYFDIPIEALDYALFNGSLEFSLDLDDFILE
ncbi:MAG: hypothetical protein HN368_22780, partial [Spirochaetales bacterium]|nr:hypothetical protein [Spirochaetales bacterium]